MKRIYAILLCVILGMGSAPAQNSNVRICTEQDIPVARRNNYVKFAKQFIENYYSALLFNVNNHMIQETFITNNMADQNARFKPEFLKTIPSHAQPLVPAAYITELDKEFKNHDIDNLTLEVSDINVQKDFYAPSMISCYVIAEYTLTLQDSGSILFKRRCRAYCLFPSAADWITVKLMQVEPVKDITAYNISKKEQNTPNKQNTQTGKNTQTTYTSRTTQSMQTQTVSTKSNKYGRKYDAIYPAKNGYCKVVFAERVGFIRQTTREEVIPPIYDDALDFSEGLAAVCLANKWGYINSTGKVIIPLKYKVALSFKDDQAKVYANGTWINIDKYGNQVTSSKTKEKSTAQETRDITSNVKQTRTWMFSAKPSATEKRKNINYDKVYSPVNGMSIVKIKGRTGFINASNRVEHVLPVYDDARNFSEGLAAVRLAKYWGYVDLNGNLAIPLKYQEAGSFKDGIARVKYNDRYINIDMWGNEVP